MFAYALTIFSGAFLLFQVQPLIGKYILPWFGGSAGVWTTCMLFFQTVLLGGYAYAHWSTKLLKPKQQSLLHLLLLAAALALLPITPSDHWKPRVAGDPISEILLLLAANLGLPFFVLSATGPLVQKWCSQTHPGVSPYRLYALSNLGSLLALVSYPFYFEWSFSRSAQAHLWAGGLVFFAVVCGFCAWRARGSAFAQASADDSAAAAGPPSGAHRLLWLALPALASVLLLATTNKLCQDLAVIPFLWVLPLGLYLLSFIICFDSPRWYRRGGFVALLMVGFAVVAELLSDPDDVTLRVQIVGYCGALFGACMLCHGELYRLKPPARHLTSFYLMIAAGGAIGGFLVAVVAPLVFTSFLELPAGYWLLSVLAAFLCFRDKSRALALGAGTGVALAVVVIPIMFGSIGTEPGHRFINLAREVGRFIRADWKEVAVFAVAAIGCFGDCRRVIVREWHPRTGGFLVLVCLALGSVLWIEQREDRESAISASRNFFGRLTVYDYNDEDPAEHYYLLEHGKITHGIQFVDPRKALWPTTYYGRTSGVGRAIGLLPKAGTRRIGLVGLGTGTLASYGTKGDYLRIYEINPAVQRLARSRFTYLANCPARVDVVLGDARLSMESELEHGQPQRFDLLALDAFNSDAIPVHLLTQEAFVTYLRHLQPDGIIAVHISNLYFDLQPVVENLAKRFDLDCVTISDDDNADWWIYDTTWMLVTRNHQLLKTPAISKAADAPSWQKRPAVPLWTDDYTSLYKILR